MACTRRAAAAWVGSLLAIAWPLHASAETAAPEPSEAEDLNLYRLEELMALQVASPAKLGQPVREAPAVMSTVTREQIQDYGWLSLNDILYKQPGFAPSQDYDRRTVTARGLFEGWNNNHLLLLIDGVPQNDNVYGSAFTWEITPLFMIKTLEIIRGPGSALYGSNATNGVLAINTRAASNVEPAVQAQLRVGNGNTQIYDLFAGHDFKRYSVVIGFNRYSTEGNPYSSLDASGRTDVTGALQKFPIRDARSSDYVFAKLTLQSGLTITFHHQDWSFETGHGWIWYIPDRKESLNEQRQILSLSYRPRALAGGRFQHQYVLQYQRHAIDWQLQFYPDGTAFDVAGAGGTTTHYDYPRGLAENLDSETHDLFARIELSYKLWREMSLLFGAENTLFIYTGDKSHSSNVDINNGGTFMPFGDGQLHPLGSWLAYVPRKPVENIGLYLQYASGRMLRRRVSLTAGLRYDLQYFNFTDINDPAQPTLSRTFNQVSPRVGIVLFPWRELTLKVLVDRAFRAPAPSELFGANTYTLASDPKTLKPEEVTTLSVAGDLPIGRRINLRANWYYEIFDNQLAYSVSKANLSTNLYSRTVTGVEAEVLWDVPLGRLNGLNGYFNYTFAHLVDEQIEDPTIAKSSVLTWAPAHVFNLGVHFAGHGFSVSAQGHFQGPVERRTSDYVNADGSINDHRPRTLAPWFTVDARASYRLTDSVRLGVQASNLLNTRGFVIKNNNFPFDYQIEGFRILGTIELDIRTFGRP